MDRYNFLVTINGHQEEFKDLDLALKYIKENFKDCTTICTIKCMAKDGVGCLNFSLDRSV